MMDLKEIAQFLDDNAPAFLATLGTCGNPRVRPIQSPLLVGDKIYFFTANTKELFKHIKNYSGIEFCSCAKDGTFLRLRANAVFEPNLEVKKMMFEKYPHLVNLYETPQNPKFEVFYLDHLSARMQFMNGEFKLFKA
ncbi:pyridoxamine 5'-phosphate oxidase family protein [Campylobacter jejuni]|uniref:pyridoxamine 5'-phosphate oxidase family protein n=1 Tax=Campylobacter jejuni TaxID=197 RepID=UPI001F08A6B8|nr:pyridoxamine 5'-phosphate oxidase family protein [Campylobacter jejuni]MCH3775563.1 pyridoxamine 5'-phosphate oxidase family protein [Campylobacter jejuni]MCH3780227.1 pyridoxamine 5'-phosphate oxidase family protein [Campylobacter jejuni]MCH3833110.1 pyridoxamine 5'-phosphate oxidase family protein [Campylobacter jejuni]MDC8075021.1 pyridoxamine 5'-phosphate oxidase family protein [Campylobacter jejuni]MDC8090694.1 pyridoxamine 5'-phosphate oxidase family protein [Campylobacter jejuni]